jgi:hypothetical protein
MKINLVLIFLFGFILSKASVDSLTKKDNHWKIYFAYNQIGAGDFHYYNNNFGERGFGKYLFEEYLTTKFLKLGLDWNFKNYLSLGLGLSFGYINTFDGMIKEYLPSSNRWKDQYSYKNKLMTFVTVSNKFQPLKLLEIKKLKWDFYFSQRIILFPYPVNNKIDLERNYILNPRLAYHFGSGISYDFKPNWGFFTEVYYLTTKKHTPETPCNFGIHYKF